MGNKDNNVSLFPSSIQGNKWTVTPWECAGSKGKFGFIMRTAKALSSLHIWVSREPTPVNQKLMCWLKCRFLTFLNEQRSLRRNCTFAWSSLSLRHSSKISCWLKLLFNTSCASNEGSGESAHLHRLTLAFVTVPKSYMMPEMAIRVIFTPAA